MAKEFGSRADMLSSKIDEVSRNRIWEEHCTKEVSKLQMNTHFAINDPTKMDCLPEKPNHVFPKVKLSERDVEIATTKLGLTWMTSAATKAAQRRRSRRCSKLYRALGNKL